MYISVFRWKSGSSRNYFSNEKTKAVASDSRKKTMRNAINRGSVRSWKKKFFWNVLLDFVGIHFSVCGILIDPGHLGDVFDIGYVPFEWFPEAAGRRRRVSCDRVNVNKPKLRNYDWLLGLPRHLQFLASTTCHLFEIRRCGCVATAAAMEQQSQSHRCKQT